MCIHIMDIHIFMFLHVYMSIHVIYIHSYDMYID